MGPRPVNARACNSRSFFRFQLEGGARGEISEGRLALNESGEDCICLAEQRVASGVDSEVAELLQRVLQGDGYQVTVASDGEAALVFLAGGAGVNFLYDFWRAAKAKFRGESFTREHGDK